MARPAALPYTLGKLSFSEADGFVTARGYFKDGRSQRREITARAKAGKGNSVNAGARRALEEKLASIKVADAARKDDYFGGDDLLKSETNLADAVEVWLEELKRQVKKDGKPLEATTLRDYRGYARRSITGGKAPQTGREWPAHPIAKMALVEVNRSKVVSAWLREIADERGPMAAKMSKKVLSSVLNLAVEREAVPFNAVLGVRTPGAKSGSAGDRKCRDGECDYDCGKRHLDTKRAFTAAEMARVIKGAEASKADIGDLSAFLFATGCRISEALKCTAWADLDLEAGTVRVRGTKTAQADRVLALSDELVERLARRALLHGTVGQVFGVSYFATKLGKPRDRANVSKRLKDVFDGANVQWAGTHTFRRTVASWMDEAGAPLAEIANQLGHADINVTAGYLGRKVQPTRARNVMVLPELPVSELAAAVQNRQLAAGLS